MSDSRLGGWRNRWRAGALLVLGTVAIAVGVWTATSYATGSVTDVSVSLSPSTAGALSTYTVGFTTSGSGALASSSTVAVSAPAGTVFSNSASDYAVAGDAGSVPVSSVAVASTAGSSTVNQAVLTLGSGAIGNDAVVTLTATNVTNPQVSASTDNLTVSTSEDLTPVASNTFAITPGAAATASGLAYATSALTPPTPDQGSTVVSVSSQPIVRDAYSNQLLNAGSYTLAGPTGGTGVTINAASGQLTVSAGATLGNWASTYTQGAAVTSATVTLRGAQQSWPLTTVDANPGQVSTFAGSGANARTDGTGTAAAFAAMGGNVVVGNSVYVAGGGAIRRVNTTTGQVTTLAGSSTAGCVASNDPTQARFTDLRGIDSDGYYLYVSDYGCGKVWRVALTGGASSIVASINTTGITYGPDGYLYVVGPTNSVYKIDRTTGSFSLFATVPGGGGNSVVSDATYLWVTSYVSCDTPCHTNITRLTVATAASANFSGPGTTSLTGQYQMASAGNYLYVGDFSNARVLRFTKPTGGAGQLAGVAVAGTGTVGHVDGTGTDAWLSSITGIASDGTNLWLNDGGNHRLLKMAPATALASSQPTTDATTVDANPGQVSTFAGSGANARTDGTGTAAAFAAMGGNVVVGNSVYVAGGGAIRRVNTTTGQVTTLAGSSTAGCVASNDPTQARFTDLRGIDSDGYYLYVSDYGCGKVWRVALTGGASSIVASINTTGITYGPDGYLYVVGPLTGLDRIDRVTGTVTGFVSITGGSGYSIASDATYLWVSGIASCDTPCKTDIARVNVSTKAVTEYFAPSSLSYSYTGQGQMISAGDYLYAANYTNTNLVRISKSTRAVTSIAGTGAVAYRDGLAAGASFGSVSGLASDGVSLWVGDSTNHRLRRVISGPSGSPISVVESAGGGNNPAEAGCGCPSGQADPVTTSTGNFWHTFTDISVPGRGVVLDVSRTYNSNVALSSVDGLFGYGWSSNYGMSLSIGSLAVTVAQEDGSRVDFIGAGSSWAPANPRTLATLAHNGDGTWTFVRRAKDTFDFDSTGRLVAQRDRNGNVTAITYPSSSSMVVTDPAGRTLTLTLSGGRVTGVADASSPARTVGYSYDGSGNLTEVVDLGGGHTQFTYDSSHRLLTMRSPRYYGDTTTSPTPVTTNHYDTSGRVDSQTDPLGRTTTFDYTSVAGSTKVTDPKGNVTLDQYTQGLLTAETHAYGTSLAATWTYGYDPVTGARTQVTDPLGRLTTFYFDAAGNRTATVDALGRVSSSTYDASGNPLTLTDPNGTVTTLTYDSHGNLVSRSTPLLAANGTTLATSTSTFHHDDASHPDDVTSVTGPDGQTVTYTYDAFGDRISTVAPPTPENPAGNKTTSAFDTTTGALVSTVSPRGNVAGATAADFTTTVEHDAFGRVTMTKDPLWSSSTPNAHRTVRHYDADGNLDYSIDANNKRTDFTYNAAGEQTIVTRADTTMTRTDYWADGSLKTQYDGSSGATAYAYDALGRLTSITDSLSRVTTYGYDLAGNRTTKQDPGGSCATNPGTGCTRYGYDAANQLTSTSYSDGTTPNVSAIGYDPDGHRTSMTDGTGTSTWTWDSLGRMTGSTNGASAAVGYGYDIAGRMTSITYPGSTGTVNRTYDAAGRLRTVVDFASRTNTFGYDADSNLITAAYGNGTTGTRTYDNTGALLTTSDANGTTTLVDLTYTRDGAGQVASTAGNGLGQSSETYAYNDLEQLTSVNAATSAFDSADNLTTLRGATQSFDVANELTSSTAGSGVTYAYDTRGNRTSMTPTGSSATTYGWDQANRVKSVGSDATYAYDGTGLRSSKTVSGTTTAFSWDVAEGLPLLLKDGSTSFIYGPGALPLEQATTSATSWFFQDQLGSTRALTDASGAVVATSTYDAFGSVAASTGSVTSPFGYTGQYTDSESGLLYLRARHYDPATGQFLSRDPLAAATRTPYAYVGGNPLNSVDPSGLFCLGGLCSQDFRMSDAVHGFVNFSDGIGDFVTSTVTLGRVRIHKTYCGAGLGASYLIGRWTGQVEAALAGGLGRAAGESEVASAVARGGESEAAATGRAMHAEFDQQLRNLNELDSRFEPGLRSGPHRPDGFFDGNPIELKPDSPSGLRAGRSQLARYMDAFAADRGYLVTYDANGAFRIAEVLG